MKFLQKKTIPKASSKIIYNNESVIKYFNIAFDIDRVVEKHVGMTTVLRANDIISPEILNVDRRQNSIEFTRLGIKDHLGKYLQKLLNNRHSGEVQTSLYEKIGRVLGFIHRDLDLPSKTESDSAFLQRPKVNINKNEDEPGNEWKVFLHGDFSLNNIFLIEDKVAVIDPVPNQTTMFHMDEFGNNEIEVSYFCNSVLRQLSLKHYNKQNIHNLTRLLNHFLAGYESETKHQVCRSDLRELVIATDKRVANKRLSNNLVKSLRAVTMKSLITSTIR